MTAPCVVASTILLPFAESCGLISNGIEIFSRSPRFFTLTPFRSVVFILFQLLSEVLVLEKRSTSSNLNNESEYIVWTNEQPGFVAGLRDGRASPPPDRS